MQISSVNIINFQKQYKAKDILRLVTGYDYKWQGDIDGMMKELSGVDYHSDEVRNMVSSPSCKLSLYNGVQAQCRRKILSKYPELKEADEDFLFQLKSCAGDRKALDTWFEAQVYLMQKSYELKPFKLSAKTLQKDNDKFMDVLNKF
ncbi:MAG: hypothetical protein IJ877_00205 [Candidatus Gastranaerophilales bacterium]|nr:hypothetical protein [Candidatus Gastranaerophilales bacterium]